MTPESPAGHWLEAIEWHTALHEDADTAWTDARLSEWRRWYAAPENRGVFEQVCQLLEDRHAYRERHRRMREADADPYDPRVAIPEWKRRRLLAPREPRSGSGRGRWIGASAGSLLIGAALLCAVLVLRPLWRGTRTSRLPTSVYQTGVGQLETVHLSDGSTVTLGARTRLTAVFTPKRRVVRLLDGEAWFRDKDIPSQPFSVQAGHGTITAIGTSFVVNRDSDRVVVTVTAGTVEVSTVPPAPHRRAIAPGAPTRSSSAVRMTGGQALSYSDHGALGPLSRASPRAATAWTQGRLIFDGVPLRYVVENVGRYWSRRITIGPRAGRLRFSGLVYENEIQDWLGGLSTIFPVSLEETDSSIRIHMRSTGAAQANQTPRRDPRC